jgi:D-alanyl-D-alanine carboxypeptidase/D-alanyl-D-alanine-endopeptidase (penicillin-binding protein 4)
MMILLLLAAADPANETPPTPAVVAALAEAGPGTRIGLVVTDDQGREIVAVRPDERFIPASNTKMFTTAAAFASLQPDATDGGGGATVRLQRQDVVLEGHGDARLSAAETCASDCLIDLAKAVAARTHVVRDVIGDDSAFPDERWPQGMSWNNIPSRYGTAVSALTIDDNVATITVSPGGAGKPPTIASDGYYTVENWAITAGTKSSLGYTRSPNGTVVRVTGTIAENATPETLTLAVDDPAQRAAWQMSRLLRKAGVRVTGKVTVRHRPVAPSDDPAIRGSAPAPRVPEEPVLARLAPPPLSADLRLTNKVSQNLHAELLLRRISAAKGSGSVADGRVAVRDMLDEAGVDRWAYDFADGGGMSTYNRLTPRAAVRFLRWTQSQNWGAAWKDTLPVGGVDGTVGRRFRDTPLQGKLFAKTGTLNAANALSGFMIAASGRTLTFSALANDMPGDSSATAAVDKALLAIAAAN